MTSARYLLLAFFVLAFGMPAHVARAQLSRCVPGTLQQQTFFSAGGVQGMMQSQVKSRASSCDDELVYLNVGLGATVSVCTLRKCTTKEHKEKYGCKEGQTEPVVQIETNKGGQPIRVSKCYGEARLQAAFAESVQTQSAEPFLRLGPTANSRVQNTGGSVAASGGNTTVAPRPVGAPAVSVSGGAQAVPSGGIVAPSQAGAPTYSYETYGYASGGTNSGWYSYGGGYGSVLSSGPISSPAFSSLASYSYAPSPPAAPSSAGVPSLLAPVSNLLSAVSGVVTGSGSGGSPAPLPVAVAIVAEPAEVRAGGSVRVSWSSVGARGASACSVTIRDAEGTVSRIAEENEGTLRIPVPSSAGEVVLAIECAGADAVRIAEEASVRIR